ncbi:MAG: acetyl-CoA carboxylase biotin carboxyl carrier protein [Candidatus Methylacidiphilales bacterium]
MELKEIKTLIDLMNKNGLAEFELEKADFKIRLKKASADLPPVSVALPTPAYPVPAPISPPPPPSTPPPSSSDLPTINSPMVGTLYVAPSPDSPPYVTVGSVVTPETVVCIIEAMKVMNEIKAEMSGTIVEILVENGKPVEFGRPLFRVKPS